MAPKKVSKATKRIRELEDELIEMNDWYRRRCENLTARVKELEEKNLDYLAEIKYLDDVGQIERLQAAQKEEKLVRERDRAQATVTSTLLRLESRTVNQVSNLNQF